MPIEYEEYVKRVMNLYTFRVQTHELVPNEYHEEIVESTMRYVQASYDTQFRVVDFMMLYDLWAGLLPYVVHERLIGIPTMYRRVVFSAYDTTVVLSVFQYCRYLDKFSEWISTSAIDELPLTYAFYRELLVSALVSYPDTHSLDISFARYGSILTHTADGSLNIDIENGEEISNMWQVLMTHVTRRQHQLPPGVTVNSLRKFLFTIVYKSYVFGIGVNEVVVFCMRWLNLFTPAFEGRLFYGVVTNTMSYPKYHVIPVRVIVRSPVPIGSVNASLDPRPEFNHEHQTWHELYWLWKQALYICEGNLIDGRPAGMGTLFRRFLFTLTRSLCKPDIYNAGIPGHLVNKITNVDLVNVSMGGYCNNLFIKARER
jgi:hypothetical protein